MFLLYSSFVVVATRESLLSTTYISNQIQRFGRLEGKYVSINSGWRATMSFFFNTSDFMSRHTELKVQIK